MNVRTDERPLDLLRAVYDDVAPPLPSAELLASLDRGAVRRGAELSRPVRHRTRRTLVALVAAAFVSFAGLALAGALPGPLQREVARVARHIGLDLPTVATGHVRVGDTPVRGVEPAPPTTVTIEPVTIEPVPSDPSALTPTLLEPTLPEPTVPLLTEPALAPAGLPGALSPPMLPAFAPPLPTVETTVPRFRAPNG
jgi:hypothetical protein